MLREYDLLGPLEGVSGLVVGVDKGVDLIANLAWRGETRAGQGFGGENGEPDLDLIEPGGMGRGQNGNGRSCPAPAVIFRLVGIHSAHVSRETTNWLAAQPIRRLTFTFMPTHGSWLNLIEGFFSKLARSVLRHIRVRSKHKLKECGRAFITDINNDPVVHTWRYKIDDAA